MSFTGPLFIVGMPRSGTKLLRGLLNRHPRIGVSRNESEFLPWLAHRFARFGDLRRRERFDAFYAEMLRHSYFRFQREQGRLIDAGRWHAACAEFSAAGVFEALMRTEVDAPRGSGRIWGDKSPSYIDDLPLLKQLYPAARVLHIVRDVRDYCLSMHKAWGKDMLRAAQRWADGVRKARKDGAALGADYLELRYEDLLARTEPELRRVCAFLGVEFEPRMLGAREVQRKPGRRSRREPGGRRQPRQVPPRDGAENARARRGACRAGAARVRLRAHPAAAPGAAPVGRRAAPGAAQGRRAPGARRPQRLGILAHGAFPSALLRHHARLTAMIKNLVVVGVSTVLALAAGEVAVRALLKDQTVMFPRYHTDYRYGQYTLRGIRPTLNSGIPASTAAGPLLPIAAASATGAISTTPSRPARCAC